MKKILIGCLVTLSLTGCATTKTCSQLQMESIKAQSHTDKVYCDSKLNEYADAWVYEYCRMMITEESRIAKLTNSKTISVPEMCASIGLDK